MNDVKNKLPTHSTRFVNSSQYGLSLLCLLSLVLLTMGMSHAEDKQITMSAEHIANLGVTLGKLETVSQVPVLYAPAKVVIPPKQEYIVSASQAGLITQLNAALGDQVRAGEVLAEINSSEIVSMQRMYLKASSELELGQLVYDREQKLLEDGVIAERRWQETRTVHNTLVAEANERRQLLEIAGMTVAEITELKKRRQLSGVLRIRAPITGIVMERMAVAGARIDSLVPLYRVANLDELWLEINIPQEHIGQIKLGDQVLLEKPPTESEAPEQQKGSLAPVTAKITLLGQTVNPENQTILARALVKGQLTDVRPGQRINTQIIQPNNGMAFTVPNTAIAQHAGQAFVFVRSAEGFTAHPVSVIGKQGDDSTIKGPFIGTEIIAEKGAVSLKANWLGLGSEE